MSEDFEKSVATKSLVAVSEKLGTTKQLVLLVNPPIQELTALLIRVDGYFGDASSFLTMIDKIGTLLHDGLQLCKWVGDAIPVVGPIIAEAATIIESTQIEQNIRRIANEINNVIKKARDGVMKEVKQAANFVSTKLEAVNEKLPSWDDTVKLMSQISLLLDMAVYAVFKDLKDDLVKKAVDALHEKFGGVLTSMDNILRALKPIGDFIQDHWETFKQNVLKPIQSGFGAILDLLKPVMGVIQKVCDACASIKEWFEPFMWVVHAVECIFEKTVGWLINKIMDTFHLNTLIDEFKQWLEKALGVRAAKEAINGLISDALDVAKEPLKKIENAAGLDSIEETVKTFTINLDNFRKDPAGTLLNVLGSSGILDDFKNWDKPIRIPIDDMPNSDPINNDSTAKDEVAGVRDTQDAMDKFIENIENSSDQPAGDQVPTPVPKLRYALYQDEPVSIRMRTIQKRVLLLQRAACSKPLVRMDPIPDKPAGDSPANTIDDDEPRYTSGGLAPRFDEYVAKCDLLVAKITTADQTLQRAVTGGRQADADFASFSPEAVAFCDELALLLQGTDPIFDAVDALLALPLLYRSTLDNVVKQWLKDAGWPGGPDAVIDKLFDIIDNTKQAVSAFRQQKTTVQGHAEEASKKYKAFHGHVARACSPDIFPKTLGPTVVSFSTLIASLQQRLKSTVSTLVVIRRGGNHFFSPDTKVGADQDKKQIAAKLNEIYGSLVKVVDATQAEVEGFTGQVEKVYESLAAIHADVQSFFKASKNISDHCRTVEAKLIAADRVRALCGRIHNIVGPFQSVLDQLGVHADAPEAVTNLKAIKRLDSAVAFASKVFDSAVFAGIKSLLTEYFHLEGVDQPMLKLASDLGSGFEDRLRQFETELSELIKKVEPGKITTYTLPTEAGKPPGPTFQLGNPLMDDSTAESLGAVLQQVNDLVAPTGGKTKTMPWAMPAGKDQAAVVQTNVEDVYLQQWGRKWDEAQPGHPSAVFIDLYTTLRSLDQLMARRTTWQRTDPHATTGESPPAALTGSDLDLWKSLDAKTTAGGAQYQPGIVAPLQKPLYDRIHQLLNGVVQLPPGATGGPGPADFLKRVPAPAPGAVVAWELPPPARDLAGAAYPDKKIPEPLASMLADQAAFEKARAALQPYLAAAGAGAIYADAQLPVTAGTEALTGLHHDYTLIEARRLLEDSGNAGTAVQFAKLAGSGDGL